MKQVTEWQSRWVQGNAPVLMLTQSGDIFTLDTLIGSIRFTGSQQPEVARYLRQVAERVENDCDYEEVATWGDNNPILFLKVENE